MKVFKALLLVVFGAVAGYGTHCVIHKYVNHDCACEVTKECSCCVKCMK